MHTSSILLLLVGLGTVLFTLNSDDIQRLLRSTNASVPLKFTNTSMHGVSQVVIDRANVVFNFKPLEHVKEQQKPDPDFPTVVFPNPEEKGRC